ncbi:hypothetical protein CsSME_00044836 [Camellia sinensis var. sinensis]
MKLVWSPETASKAYIDTVKSCELFQESSVAELISAMAGGWNASLIAVFLPVGKGLDIAHVAGSSGSGKSERRWIKQIDQQSGEEYVIRKRNK